MPKIGRPKIEGHTDFMRVTFKNQESLEFIRSLSPVERGDLIETKLRMYKAYKEWRGG